MILFDDVISGRNCHQAAASISGVGYVILEGIFSHPEVLTRSCTSEAAAREIIAFMKSCVIVDTNVVDLLAIDMGMRMGSNNGHDYCGRLPTVDTGIPVYGYILVIKRCDIPNSRSRDSVC